MRGLLLLIGLVACSGVTEDTAPDPDLSPTSGVAIDAADQADDEVLLSEAYRFCHEGNIAGRDVRTWCELVDELDPERCPGLVETCAADPALDEGAPPVMSGCNGSQGGGEPNESFSAPEAPTPPPPEPWDLGLSGCSCEPPATGLGLFQAVLAVAGGLLIALLVAVMVRLIVVAVIRRQRPPEAAPVTLLAVEEDDDVPPDVPDLPSDDLLSAARRALDAGLLDEAVLLARSAALRSLGDAGRVKLHRSRTDREYVRMVRGDSEIYGPLREIFRAVERVRWGGARRPSTDKVRAVFEAASRILKVAGVVMLVAVLTAANGDDRYAPHGDAALHDLFSDYGYDAHWRLRPIAKLDESTDVLVLDLTQVDLLDGDDAVLRSWVGDGGILMVAGDASEVFSELGDLEWLAPVDHGVAPGVDAWVDAVRLPGNVMAWKGGSGRAWSWVSEPTGGTLFVPVGDRPATVQAMPWGAGGIVALGDGRLLSNVALLHPANERMVGLAPMLGQFTSMWYVDRVPRLEIATLNAASAGSPMESIANAALLPAVLQLLLLAFVAAAWKGIPFRPLRDPPEEGRLSFAEHVRALGTHYSRRGGSRRAASAYANLLLTVSGKRALEEAARRAGLSDDAARDLVSRAEAAAHNPDDAASPHLDLKLMEELWKIDPTR